MSLNWIGGDWCFFCVVIARPNLRAYRDVIVRSGAVLAVIALLFVAAPTPAGEIEPRSYVNTPVGINFLLALSGTYDYGGRSTIDGVRSDELDNNSRAGVTLALPVNRNNSIKLFASTGVQTITGSDFNLAGIVWQYRWGHGL